MGCVVVAGEEEEEEEEEEEAGEEEEEEAGEDAVGATDRWIGPHHLSPMFCSNSAVTVMVALAMASRASRAASPMGGVAACTRPRVASGSRANTSPYIRGAASTP